MSQPVLLKAYGHIYPVESAFERELAGICAEAFPQDNLIIEHDGDLLRIAFEGIFFPLNEALLAIERELKPFQKGKLDILDIENWKMTRHIFENGKIASHGAPLNNVLDYSGH